MNTAAKGRRLEAKSRQWLKTNGALAVFRGKGDRRTSSSDGCAQVDLIAFFPDRVSLVEVTVPSNRARARKRLEGFHALNRSVHRYVHTWRDRAKEPEVEQIGTNQG